ncbi:MAG: EAL domain-containing protein, partial [Oscillospiraceae bacterium]
AAEEDLLFISRCYPHLFSNIVIEITEAESDSPEKFQRKLGFIKEHGMQLAIDDFGSGYSNELRILSMNPDIIKVDMALIQGIHENQDQQQLVANLISFCHPRGIRLIAEGVETSEDLAAIIRLGVDYVQGYYTGRPAFEFVPVDPAIQQEILRYRAEADAAGGTP